MSGTIMMVHGSEHGSWCWENFEEYFTGRGYTVCSANLREKGKKSDSLDDYAAALAGLIRELGESPVVITHSLGSAVLQRFVKEYPGLIRVLIFLSPTPPARIYRALTKVKYHMLTQTRSSLFFSDKPASETAAGYLGRLKKESLKIQIQVLKRVWQAGDVPPIPCLVIGAWDDRCMPVSAICDMGRYLDCKTVILPGLSHDMMLTPGWESVAGEIQAFLNAL